MKKIVFIFLFCSTTLWGQTPHEITLHISPSPKGYDFSTPRSLAWSALKNRLSTGEVFIEINCNAIKELVGVRGKNFDYLNQLMLQGHGLGIFFQTVEGELLQREKIQTELNERLQKGHGSFVRFILNSAQCVRATKYLQEFRKYDVAQNFGLVNRPRYGEGASSTTFAVSFLDVLGIIEQEMKESWTHTILLPLELVGPPKQNEPVSFIKLLFHSGRWATDKEKYIPLTLWVPDRIDAWVKKKVSLNSSSHPVEQREKTSGIVIDKSHFPSLDTPIWLQSTDPNYKKEK